MKSHAMFQLVSTSPPFVTFQLILSEYINLPAFQTCRELIMPLPSVLDDQGDEYHKTKDKQMFDAIPEFDGAHDMEVAFFLINFMSCPSEDLEFKWDQASVAKIIQENARELANLIKDSYQRRTFKSVRSLDIFQSTTQRKCIVPQGNIGLLEQERAAELAWKTPFIGNSDKLLAKTIQDMNAARGNNLYANYMPIVQSSGAGKSRIVHEVAASIFTLPFDLGGEANHSSYTSHRPDSCVRDLILKANPTVIRTSSRIEYVPTWSTFEFIQAVILTFFKYLFREVYNTINQGLDISALIRSDELAQRWRSYLEQGESLLNRTSNRAEIYQRIVVQVKEELSMPDYIYIPIESIGDEVVAAVDTLVKLLSQSKNPEDKIQILLYFDDVHTLANTRVNQDPNGRNYYDALCSTFSFLTEFPLFTVTLSTSPHISTISRSSDEYYLGRILLKRDHQQAPFGELAFDCLENNTPIFRTGITTLAEISTVEFLVKFGRPLFYARWKASQSLPSIRKDMMNFARTKLLGNPYCNRDRARLAILSTRLLFDFEPRCKLARLLEERMVRDHMRIVYDTQHCGLVRSGAPSEPILAEAAAQEMNQGLQDEESSYVSIPHSLSLLVEHSVVKKGESGELAMRLLFIMAYDAAAKLSCNRDNVELFYSRPVPLYDFLDALFGTANFQTLLESHAPNYPNSATFGEVYEHAYVRFTHFVRYSKDSAIDSRTALAAFVRGMAIQCSPNQSSLNAVLPVLILGKEWKNKAANFEDIVLKEEHMSSILIRLEDTHCGSRTAVIDEAQICKGSTRPAFFSEVASHINLRPYVSLVMNLRGQARDKVSVEDPEFPVVQAGHPCFPIYAVGCSHSVYGIIPANNETSYASLLGNDVPEECPRQSEDNIAAARRLKPFWEEGPQCYDWMDDPVLHIRRSRQIMEPAFYTGYDALYPSQRNSSDEDMQDC